MYNWKDDLRERNLPQNEYDTAYMIRDFLQSCWEDQPGWAELMLFHLDPPPGYPRIVVGWADLIDYETLTEKAVLAAIHNHQNGYGVHLAPCTRREGKDRYHRGNAEDAFWVPVLWADVDDSDGALLNSFSLRPSFIFNTSPNSWHAYWILHTAVQPTDRVSRILRGLASAVGGDPNVTDFARTMRMPGTINTKYGNLVEVVEWDENRRYQLEDFDWLDAGPELKRVQRPRVERQNPAPQEVYTARQIAEMCGNVKQSGQEWLVSCPNPTHGKGRGDRSRSLEIRDSGDGRILMKCFAGCENDEIVRALGLTMSNLFVDDTRPAQRHEIWRMMNDGPA